MGRTYYKMSIKGKIKTINNKIKQNKAQYNLDRKAAMISALLSGNVSKYEFLTGKDVLPTKDLLEKVTTMKRFEYSLLGKELKKQTSVAEKQYQKLDNSYEFDKIIEKENYSKSNLIYDPNHSFHKYYCDRKNNDNLSFLNDFFNEFNKLINVNPQKESTKERKINVYDTASELYNYFLGIYYHQYYELSVDK